MYCAGSISSCRIPVAVSRAYPAGPIGDTGNVVSETEIVRAAGEIQRFRHCFVVVGVWLGRSVLLIRGGDEIPAVVAADGRNHPPLGRLRSDYGTKMGPPGFLPGNR